MEMPVVPAHPVRWAASDAVLVLLGAQLLSLFWAGFAITTVYHGDVPEPVPMAALVVLNVGLWLGYGLGPALVARLKGRDLRHDFGATARWLDAPLGLVVGVVTQLALVPLLYVPVSWFVDGDPSDPARELVSSAAGWADTALLVLATVVMAPLVEELFFRGLFLRSLQQRFGPVVAVVVTALVFALVHRELVAIPGLFLFGVLTAGLTLWSGRLGPAWAMHVGFNLTTLVMLGLF